MTDEYCKFNVHLFHEQNKYDDNCVVLNETVIPILLPAPY